MPTLSRYVDFSKGGWAMFNDGDLFGLFFAFVVTVIMVCVALLMARKETREAAEQGIPMPHVDNLVARTEQKVS